MKDVDLLPCPCCGNDVIDIETKYHHHTQAEGCRIVCHDCGVGLVEDDWTKEEAVKRWNKRQKK